MNIKLSKEVFEKVELMSKMMNMPKSQCVNLLVSQWLEDRKKGEK